MGVRAVVGKFMMDSDRQAPARLPEETRASIDESVALRKRWDGRANGRLHAAFAPRFAVSCSRELLEAVADLSARDRVIVHTHASENRDEIDLVRTLSGGLSNLEYLADTGLATPHLCTAHCVWVSDAEQALLAERDVKVMHCPSSYLKLGSGIAPVVEMRARGISVSLGAASSEGQNRLGMFGKNAARRDAPGRSHASGALTARDAVDGPRVRGPARSGCSGRSGRSSPASARTSSSWNAIVRTWRRTAIPGRRWCMPRAGRTSA
jgi:cytosine/adenosine deaminase-related metal-dependent hydrolase